MGRTTGIERTAGVSQDAVGTGHGDRQETPAGAWPPGDVPLDWEWGLAPLEAPSIFFLDIAEPGALERARRLRKSPGAILVALSALQPPADLDIDVFDLALTSAALEGPDWVSVADLDRAVRAVGGAVDRCPRAALMLSQSLRIVGRLEFEAGLCVESMAYSTLLGGAEFRTWLGSRPERPTPPCEDGPPVLIESDGEILRLVLNRPRARNAISAAMRDALVEALALGLYTPEVQVRLEARGACFSTGGELTEFGSQADHALAHQIRTSWSPARLLHRLGMRATARVHGACIGSGIEVPAAAGRLIAAPDAWFQLPEVSMGLIPGAGGVVTISRRIGRHRTLFMALSARRIGAARARDWGLVDALEAP